MIYRGCVAGLLASQSFANSFTKADYDRFKRWGLNAVYYDVWWGEIERDENSPSIYEESYLSRFETVQLPLARSRGLKPFIGVHVSSGPDNAQTWQGWPSFKGADYVNLNQADSSGFLGRDRYVAFLQMLAQRFPDVGICVWHFPYHAENPDAERVRILHGETIPILYNAVRSVSTAPIIVNPVKQGQSPPWETGLATGIYAILEGQGWPFAVDPRLYYGFSNHSIADNFAVCCQCQPWNGDTARIDQHYAPLVAFKNRHPQLKFICVESLSLAVFDPCSQRPIDQSRLDWAAAQMQKMNDLKLGWFYWKYNNPPFWASPIEPDGSDNAVALLLAQFSPTPISPLGWLLPLALIAGFLWLFGKKSKRRG